MSTIFLLLVLQIIAQHIGAFGSVVVSILPAVSSIQLMYSSSIFDFLRFIRFWTSDFPTARVSYCMASFSYIRELEPTECQRIRLAQP